MKKLNVLKFALALGITYAIGILLFTIMMANGWGTNWLPLIQSVYRGTDTTVTGAITAVIWAFFDAFIGGLFFAWMYNLLNKK